MCRCVYCNVLLLRNHLHGVQQVVRHARVEILARGGAVGGGDGGHGDSIAGAVGRGGARVASGVGDEGPAHHGGGCGRGGGSRREAVEAELREAVRIDRDGDESRVGGADGDGGGVGDGGNPGPPAQEDDPAAARGTGVTSHSE